MAKSDFVRKTDHLEELLANVLPSAEEAMRNYELNSISAEPCSPKDFHPVLATIMRAVEAWESAFTLHRLGYIEWSEEAEAWARLKTAELRRLLGDPYAECKPRWEEWAKMYGGLGDMPYPQG